jgi:perosamine synthetase
MLRVGRTIPPAAVPISPGDILRGLRGVVRGRREIERFESEVTKYFDVGHCFLVSSGKAALALILEALKDLYPDRVDVLIPAFCCYSVPSAIVRAGLKVRLCDVDPETLDFDFDQLERILSDARGIDRLLAVIPIHLFGIQSDIDRVRRLVKDSSVSIIEDAAQVLGSTDPDGKKMGTKGDAGVFSLGRGKALSAVEGGIIITDRADIAARIRSRIASLGRYGPAGLLALFVKAVVLLIFQSPGLFWLPKSLPFLNLGETIFDPRFKVSTLSAFQAGLAEGWRMKIEGLKSIRKMRALRWIEVLKACNRRNVVPVGAGNWSDLIRFPIRISPPEHREEILGESARRGLGIMATYPASVDRIPELCVNSNGLSIPGAQRCANELVTLPVHPFVRNGDVLKIEMLLDRVAWTMSYSHGANDRIIS